MVLPRAYGEASGTVRDLAAVLPVLARKTRAWGESPIRGDVPDALREAFDGMDAAARRASTGRRMGRSWNLRTHCRPAGSRR